jgi:hypothetical protein
LHWIGRCTSFNINSWSTSYHRLLPSLVTVLPFPRYDRAARSVPPTQTSLESDVGMYLDVQAKNRSNRSFVLRVHPRKLSTCYFSLCYPSTYLSWFIMNKRVTCPSFRAAAASPSNVEDNIYIYIYLLFFGLPWNSTHLRPQVPNLFPSSQVVVHLVSH